MQFKIRPKPLCTWHLNIWYFFCCCKFSTYILMRRYMNIMPMIIIAVAFNSMFSTTNNIVKNRVARFLVVLVVVVCFAAGNPQCYGYGLCYTIAIDFSINLSICEVDLIIHYLISVLLDIIICRGNCIGQLAKGHIQFQQYVGGNIYRIEWFLLIWVHNLSMYCGMVVNRCGQCVIPFSGVLMHRGEWPKYSI